MEKKRDIKHIIKDRREKINQGIVPEGYKKTRVGIIPEDWEVKKLGEISNVISGGTPKTKVGEYWNGDIMWATPTDITNSEKIIFKTERTITEKGLKKSSAQLLPVNSILMTSRATIGERAINKEPMATNQGFKSLVPNEKSHYEFLYYLIDILKSRLIRLANGSTFLEVSTKDVYNLQTAIPNISEQQKIADVLSTWDRAIELKESFIQEKEEQKRGLRQRLMGTVPKDSDQVVRLGDILDYEQPGKYITNDISEEGKTPILTANKAFLLGYTNEGKGIYNDYPSIIFDDFTTDIKYVDFPFKVRSSAIKILKLKDTAKANLKYLYEKMALIKYPRGGHKRYYISEYQFIKVNLPPLPEQQRIAKILSTADREIELLKQEVEQLKEQKKGLMQLLLTGIVRVKEVEHE